MLTRLLSFYLFINNKVILIKLKNIALKTAVKNRVFDVLLLKSMFPQGFTFLCYTVPIFIYNYIVYPFAIVINIV